MTQANTIEHPTSFDQPGDELLKTIEKFLSNEAIGLEKRVFELLSRAVQSVRNFEMLKEPLEQIITKVGAEMTDIVERLSSLGLKRADADSSAKGRVSVYDFQVMPYIEGTYALGSVDWRNSILGAINAFADKLINGAAVLDRTAELGKARAQKEAEILAGIRNDLRRVCELNLREPEIVRKRRDQSAAGAYSLEAVRSRVHSRSVLKWMQDERLAHISRAGTAYKMAVVESLVPLEMAKNETQSACVFFYIDRDLTALEAAMVFNLLASVSTAIGMENLVVDTCLSGSYFAKIRSWVKGKFTRKQIEEGGKAILQDLYDMQTAPAGEKRKNIAEASKLQQEEKVIGAEAALATDAEVLSARKRLELANAKKAEAEADILQIEKINKSIDLVEKMRGLTGSVAESLEALASKGGSYCLGITASGRFTLVSSAKELLLEHNGDVVKEAEKQMDANKGDQPEIK